MLLMTNKLISLMYYKTNPTQIHVASVPSIGTERTCFCFTKRSIHKSVHLTAGRKWRERNEKAPKGNEFGPLTDNPDWSYADGRMGRLAKGQKRRLVEQEGYARKVVQLLKEVDFAVEREANIRKDAEEQRQKLLEKKLKPKGNVYLTQNPS